MEMKINFNKSFIGAFADGEVTIENVNDYIEYWHTHNTGNGLREFLGMTPYEYSCWLKNDDALFDIVKLAVRAKEI